MYRPRTVFGNSVFSFCPPLRGTVWAVLLILAGTRVGWCEERGTAELAHGPETVERVAADREETTFVGVNGGVGFGSFIFGGQEKHDIAFLNIAYGRAIGGRMGAGALRGRWQWIGEVSFGHEIDPGNAWLVSLTPLVRYRFETWETVQPFLEGGYGITWTDLGEPDLGGDWQFNGVIGGGLSWYIRPDVAWTFQYRFIHYSNAGLRDPNSGVNLHTALTGVSYFF